MYFFLRSPLITRVRKRAKAIKGIPVALRLRFNPCLFVSFAHLPHHAPVCDFFDRASELLIT